MTTFINAIEIGSEQNDVHFIPCFIDYNGRASISAYFKENGKSNENVITSFRGRPFLGTEIEVPANYTGYVLRKPETDCIPRSFEIQQSFKNIKYWNLDRVPSKNDAMVSALDWLDISKVIHQKETAIHVDGNADCNGTNK